MRHLKPVRIFEFTGDQCTTYATSTKQSRGFWLL